MSTKLEKLFFAIGVRDDGASNKVAKLQSNIEKMTKRVEGHFKGIGTAVLGVVGAGLSIQQIAGPAVELNRALGEVGSLGVADADLEKLQRAAGKFAFAYGGAAVDVVRASYDIQSAIAGLSGDELASFTTAGGVLAKATKADVGTITSYMGTMYGIFEQQAARMGKAAWVDQLAGRTAYAVQIFKTSGSEMSSAFTALGANAQAAGIEASEQMAVLGMLQSTMSGSEAGGKYKAYLSGLGQAQKALGLNFTDSQGKMLGMVDVLEKIRGKYGETLTVAQADELKKAFGSDEAVALIKLMLSQTGALKKNITDIGNIKGIAHAERMAKRQTDAFQRFGAAVDYVRANAMQKLLPTFSRWANKATEQLEVLNKWITRYPNLTRVVGYCVLAVLSLAGVAALATLAFHLWKLTAMPLTGAIKGVTSVFKLLTAAIRANPILFLISMLILCIVYWDEVSAAVGFLWGELRGFFESLGPMGKPFLAVMDAIEERWRMVTDLFTDFTWTKLFKAVITSALLPLELFVNSLGALVDYIPGMADQAAALKGFKASALADEMLGTGPGAVPGLGAPGAAQANMLAGAAAQIELAMRQNPELASLSQAKTSQVREGGVMASSQTRVNNNGKTVTIGEQHLHFETPPGSMDDVYAIALD